MTIEKEEGKSGCPTLAVQAENAHKKAYVRAQKAMAKQTTQASDIICWLLQSIHTSVNPANIGLKDAEGKDIYQPLKYKENTQVSVAKEFLSNNKEFLKAKEDLLRAEKALNKETHTEDDEDEDGIPLLDLSAVPVSKALN